jgi:hypothetical protein
MGFVTMTIQELIHEARFEGLTSSLETASSHLFIFVKQQLSLFLEIQQYFQIQEIKHLQKIEDKNMKENVFDYWKNLIRNSSTSSSSSSSSLGLIAGIVRDCFVYHHFQQSSYLPSIFEHIQSTFQQMKNKGLGLLSKGLGR